MVRAAARRRVCAVVITSRERFGSWPDLPDRLERLGYRARSISTPTTTRATDSDDAALGLWQREDCRP